MRESLFYRIFGIILFIFNKKRDSDSVARISESAVIYPDRFFFLLTGRFTIYSSRPEHVHTVPHPSQTTISHQLSYIAPQHRAQRQARAPHASATAYVSNA